MRRALFMAGMSLQPIQADAFVPAVISAERETRSPRRGLRQPGRGWGRVKEQWHSVTMHGHAGERFLETLDVQAAPSSRRGHRNGVLTGEPR